jgi:hypothetical protein
VMDSTVPTSSEHIVWNSQRIAPNPYTENNMALEFSIL